MISALIMIKLYLSVNRQIKLKFFLKLPAISFWDLNPLGGLLRHEIGTVPSTEQFWLFVVWSPLFALEEVRLAVGLANAEFVELELGATRRTKAVVGDGRSITSTCCPLVTESSPGQLGELTWSSITHVVSQLWKSKDIYCYEIVENLV